MPLQTRGLGLQRDIQICRRHGGEILGDVLLRVGVVLAAQFGIHGGRLIGAHSGAAAKRHVLLGMRHAREIRPASRCRRPENSSPR